MNIDGRILRIALVLGLCAPLVTVLGPSQAASGDGTVTVNVVRDVNGNGTHEPALELGVPGIPVTVDDATGGSTTIVTNAAGTALFKTGDISTLVGGKYRVRAAIPAGMSYLQPAPANQSATPPASALSSLVEFVNVSGGKATTVTMGVWNPADYCQANPNLAVPCQKNLSDARGKNAKNGDVGPGFRGGDRALITYPYSSRGDSGAPTKVATQAQVGTTYGLAYQRSTGRLFAGATAKRHTAYGPSGPGAIYVNPAAGGTPSLFATALDPGATTHNAADLARDFGFFDIPGKESLGELDISEDDTRLYAVNLKTRSLLVYDATGPTAAAPLANVPIPPPNVACNDNARDWRPHGLGVRDGRVYVGGVCSAESSQNREHLRAVIRVFDPATNTFAASPIVDQKLDFLRGTVWEQKADTSDALRDIITHWNPWETAYTAAAMPVATSTGSGNAFIMHPQPMLTDIAFDVTGSLLLGFRDRAGDQFGHDAYLGIPDDNRLVKTQTGGDVNKACRNNDGSFSWEGTGTCLVNKPSDADKSGPEKEFFVGDHALFDGVAAKKWKHQETSSGGLVSLAQQATLASTGFDTTGAAYTAGVGYFARDTGLMGGTTGTGYLITPVDAEENFGKAAGLGDLEAICDQAPVQIGNRAWFDTDGDGLQEAAEPPLPGVKVTLLNAANAVVATATTNARGEYYFGAAESLARGTDYKVTFDFFTANTTGVRGTPAANTLALTRQKAGAGGQDEFDSDPNLTGEVAYKTGGPGVDNHRIDAGVFVPNSLGDFVWDDKNLNGLQDKGEPGVAGVTVNLCNSAGNPLDGDGDGTPDSRVTDKDGKYLFTRLPDGVYRVCFGLDKLPGAFATYKATKVGGGEVNLDSNAEVTTFKSGPATLGPANRNDLSVDAGIFVANKLGDFVWEDKDADGTQDTGEPGVEGVVVTLCDGAGKPKDIDGVGGPETRKTDTAGKYLFDGLPDGTYQSCFGLGALPKVYAGFLPTGANAGDDGLDSDADPTTFVTAATTLGSAKRADLTLDAGIKAAPMPPKPVPPPTNTLGDFVWDDTDGDAVQDDGEPGVKGVTVTLCDTIGQPLDINSDKMAEVRVTGSDGRYLFEGLPDGTYRVCFGLNPMPAGYAGYGPTKTGGQNSLDLSVPGSTGFTSRSTTLGPSPSPRTDPTLDTGIVKPNRLGDFVFHDQNRNGVQDTGEAGVPDVSVTLCNGEGNPVDLPGDAENATTSSVGRYLFDNLPDGTYRACFRLGALTGVYAGYLPTTADVGNDETDSDADGPAFTSAPTTLGPGRRQDLTLDAGIVAPPAPTNRLGDLVWDDTNGDGRRDPGEPGVPGVNVTLCDAVGAPLDVTGDGNAETDVTDDMGLYLFEGLPDGTYRVCFDLDNLPAPFEMHGPTKPGGDNSIDPAGGHVSRPTTLGSAKREDPNLDTGIVKPNRLGDRVFEDLDGDGVQGPDDPGVEGVTVTLCNDAGTPLDVTGDGKAETQKTNDKGMYLFDGLPDGTYRVCFGLGPALPELYARYTPTKANTPADDATDSDADVTTFVSGPTNLGPEKRQDLTVDAGIVKPPPAPPAPPPTYALGDLVWDDSDGNGQRDTGEPGVPGVTVTLCDSAGNPLDLDGTAGADTDLTDAAGLYGFDGLPNGTYRVCFGFDTLPGDFAGYGPTGPGSDNSVDPALAGPTGSTSKPTVLGPDQPVDLTRDAGIVRPNRLGDLVFVDLDGDGVQDTDEPGAAGVTVTLCGESGDEVDPDGNGTVDKTVTDADGRYLFDNLPDGKYRACFGLGALPPGYAGYTVTTPDSGPDDKDSDAGATDFKSPVTTLGPSLRQDLTLDAGIVPPPAVPNRLGDLVWDDRDGNGLIDEGEPGVPGVTVVLCDLSGNPVDLDSGPVQTTTDGSGLYLFEGMPDGTYRVCFKLDMLPPDFAGYGPTRTGGDNSVDPDPDLPEFVSEPVNLGKDHRVDTTLDTGIVKPNRLGDLVFEDLDRDGLQGPDEPGVPDVAVTLCDDAGGPKDADVDGTPEQVATDADGRYLFDGLPDGTYRVCFDLGGLPAAYEGYTPTGADAGDDALDSDADPTTFVSGPTTLGAERRQDLTIDAGIVAVVPDPPVEPAGVPVNRLGDLVWDDRDGDGTLDAAEPGVPGVVVTLCNEAGQPLDVNADGKAETRLTDAGGRYLFDGLPDGTYRVCFGIGSLPPAYQGYLLTRTGGDNTAEPGTFRSKPTTLGVDKRVDPTLDAGIVAPNRLGDLVCEDGDGDGALDPGEPFLAGVTVTLTDKDGNALDTNGDGTPETRVTGPDGLYSFSGIPDGTYRVRFSLAGGAVSVLSQEATVGPDLRADLGLDRCIGSPKKIEEVVTRDPEVLGDTVGTNPAGGGPRSPQGIGGKVTLPRTGTAAASGLRVAGGFLLIGLFLHFLARRPGVAAR